MRNGAIAEEVAHVKPRLIPMLKFPDDDSWRVDSTPMAYELEARYEDDRSIVPSDPAQRFLSDLIEDFADEWFTKAMFHYRWYYAADRDFRQAGSRRTTSSGRMDRRHARRLRLVSVSARCHEWPWWAARTRIAPLSNVVSRC